MIIEGAFLKLPELLLGEFYPKEQYEATLTNYLAMAVLLELSARNIQLPMDRIHIEKPYPEIAGQKPPGRADLYINLEGLFTKGLYHNLYGMKTNNWIEAKFFSGIGRQIGNQTKVTNTAKIAFDLFRLCLFVQERQSSYRDNVRYSVIVFNREPGEYLAFGRLGRTNTERKWLKLLLMPGKKTIHISLKDEPPTFRKAFGKITKRYNDLNMTLNVETRSFSPIKVVSKKLYWGYLNRIIYFEITIGEDKLTYEDTSQEIWSGEKVKIQKHMIKKFL